MPLNKSKMIGLSCIIAWCFFSAFAMVMTSHINQKIEPIVLCFFTFLLANIVFYIVNANKIFTTYKKIVQHHNVSFIVWLNLSTFCSWFFLIYPLKYIPATMVSTITLGLSPIATLFFERLLYKKKIYKQQYIRPLLLLAIIVYIIAIYFTVVSPAIFLKMLLALLSCFIVGISTSLNNIYIKKLNTRGFHPTEILCVRFFVMLLITAIYVFFNYKVQINFAFATDIMLVAICLVIVPLYLMQVALRELEPITVAAISPLMPLLAIVFDISNHQNYLQLWIIPATLATCILVVMEAMIEYKKILHKNKIEISDE